MRFMIIVKATTDSEAGLMPGPEDGLMDEMVAYHEDLAKAGVLLDGRGLHPTSKGFRIRYAGDRCDVVDGPFAETKELIAGYTVIQVRSREEAMEWSRRFPRPFPADVDCEIEVRRLYELEDFGTDPALDRMREIGLGTSER